MQHTTLSGSGPTCRTGDGGYLCGRRGSERALALFPRSSALRTSSRRRYTPAQQVEAIHAAKSHRNRRIFQRELRQSS
jgi:hypothetical protein